MKFVAPLMLGLLAVSCGSGSSTSAGIPQADACNQASQAACTKLFSCTDSGLALAKLVLGNSATACQAFINPKYCAMFSCTAGQTYHGDKAKQCKDQFATVSCSSLAAAAATASVTAVLASVPVCGEICTGGDADASSGG